MRKTLLKHFSVPAGANPHEPPALAQTLAGSHFPINAGRFNMTRSTLVSRFRCAA
jgi:hypothetical protein